MIGRGAIREVGSVDDLGHRHELGESAERDRVRDLCRVVMEAIELRLNLLAGELAAVGTRRQLQQESSENEVSAPPPCEKIQLMSRNFCDEPLKIRLAMLRVVSVPHSIADDGIPCTRLTQQLASPGWV